MCYRNYIESVVCTFVMPYQWSMHCIGLSEETVNVISTQQVHDCYRDKDKECRRSVEIDFA